MHSPDFLLTLTTLLLAHVSAWSLGRTRILTQARVALARIDAETEYRIAAMAHQRDRLLLAARDRLPGCTTGSPLARPVGGTA